MINEVAENPDLNFFYKKEILEKTGEKLALINCCYNNEYKNFVQEYVSLYEGYDVKIKNMHNQLFVSFKPLDTKNKYFLYLMRSVFIFVNSGPSDDVFMTKELKDIMKKEFTTIMYLPLRERTTLIESFKNNSILIEQILQKNEQIKNEKIKQISLSMLFRFFSGQLWPSFNILPK